MLILGLHDCVGGSLSALTRWYVSQVVSFNTVRPPDALGYWHMLLKDIKLYITPSLHDCIPPDFTLSRQRVWRWLSSAMLRRVVWLDIDRYFRSIYWVIALKRQAVKYLKRRSVSARLHFATPQRTNRLLRLYPFAKISCFCVATRQFLLVNADMLWKNILHLHLLSIWSRCYVFRFSFKPRITQNTIFAYNV
jgi:hypothetical protein